MKRLVKYAICSVMALVVAVTFYSCSTGYKGRTLTVGQYETAEERYQRNQERLRNQYGTTLSQAAEALALEVSDIVSPRSGREQSGKAELYGSEIVEDQSLGYVSCKATLLWQARDVMRNVPYDWCQVKGELYYFPNKGIIEFRCLEKNNQVIAVSKDKALNKLNTGLSFRWNPNSRKK